VQWQYAVVLSSGIVHGTSQSTRRSPYRPVDDATSASTSLPSQARVGSSVGVAAGGATEAVGNDGGVADRAEAALGAAAAAAAR
jgi:hypothetical protein